jgi:formate dehydrogenase subunit delta
MHIEYLIQMANDIAAFFASEASEDIAAAGILEHIHRFWDPRMKAQIIAHYHETGGADLQGAVLSAIRQLADETAVKQAK